MLRWKFSGERKRHKWPDWVPSPYADTPPPRVDGNSVRFSFVGHASWLIQTAAQNILVDPVWRGARLSVLVRGSEASQRSRHCIRRVATDRHGAGLARAL